jgi:hypothetical protein
MVACTSGASMEWANLKDDAVLLTENKPFY